MKRIILFAVIIGIFTSFSCTNKEKKKQLSEEKMEIYLDQGKLITSLSFGVLSKTLRKAYINDGVSGAIKYCSLKAHPLIDSLSKEYSVRIKRTSLQIRNQENSPAAYEKEILDYYADQFDKREDLLPEVKMLDNGTVAFFAPIKINTPLCLNCHGKLVETLFDENYKVIREIYPDDKAIGYNLNDLRGMWSITFETSENEY